jgi:hypothetical protein
MNMSSLHRLPMRLFGLAASSSALVLALSAAASPSSPNTSTTRDPGYLYGVSAASPSSAWAVGYRCVPDCTASSAVLRTLILHWNGSAWTEIASPNPGSGERLLNAVSALSHSRAWAVGQYRTTSGGFKTLVLRSNGSRWAQVASPSPEVVDGSFLFGVAAVSPSDAWAVGWVYGPGGENSNTLILRWNGRRWGQVRSPNPVHLGFNVLNAVSALSPSDAWTVGSTDTGTLIARWNGTRWARVPSPSPGSTGSDVLNAVSALSASHAWAVGGTGASTLILRWNGANWSTVPNPSPGRGGDLNAVSSVSSSDAWAVGCYLASPSTNEFKPLVLHWNGTAWAQVASPNPGGSTGTCLTGVNALSSSDAWAVGATDPFGTDTKTVILHWNGTSWTQS